MVRPLIGVLVAIVGKGNLPPQQKVAREALAAIPWDVATQGPLVAVAPIRMVTGTSLDDLDRRMAKVGGLTAIVPKTMITVNSKFTTAPNMYEGLPQEAKVLYLFRSLTSAQMAKATGEGLSIGDCKGEQVAVFDSILPNPLRYSSGTATLDNGVRYNATPKIVTLEGNERAKVKLRFVRHLWLQIALANNGGYTAHDLPEKEKEGAVTAVIQDDKDEEFGQKILIKGPNVPRKSQLDLNDRRLGATITFVDGERVKALVDRIATATGIRFVADPHFANMPVVERGMSAYARDLLGALS